MTLRTWTYSALGIVVLGIWLTAPAPTTIVSYTEHPQTRLPALPSNLERPVLQAASRDPFVSYTAPAPPVTKPIVPVRILPPPLPSPPPLNLTFTGKTTTPDGRQLIYASVGDTVMSLTVGMTLPNGYTVTAITPQAVELHYAPLNTAARLDLPPSPTYEIR
jgi:hypothetical protein